MIISLQKRWNQFPLTPALSAYSAEVASGYVGRAPGERV